MTRKPPAAPPTQPAARVWLDFYALMDTFDVPDDFMSDRPMNTPPQERALFTDDD